MKVEMKEKMNRLRRKNVKSYEVKSDGLGKHEVILEMVVT